MASSEPVRVYVCRDLVEESVLETLLADEGIEVVRGEASSTFTGMPFAASGTSLWVHAEDARRALEVLARHVRAHDRSGQRRVCPRCGEANPPQFTLCWSCAEEVSAAPLLAVTQEEEKEEAEGKNVATATPRLEGPLRIEFLVVLAVLWVPWVLLWLWSPVEPFLVTLSSEVQAVGLAVGEIALLVYLVGRHGRWRELGLHRFVWWQEILWAFCLLWVFWFMSLFSDSVAELVGFPRPESDPRVLDQSLGMRILFPFSMLLAVAAEEVLFRGYLWSRLTRWTGRPLLSCVLCSALFAVTHQYSASALLGVFAIGLAASLSFWLSRSLPRLVLAHWAWNLLVSLDLYT